jgi:hypothetical protein
LSKKLFKFSLVFVICLFTAALIITGANNYPGSKLLYMLFSVVFWLMLLSSIGKRTHYGYLFLSVALWLGFWGKITAHLLLDYPYLEPTGGFDGSSTAWNSVLWVAISASAGVMLGKLLLSPFRKNYSRAVTADEAKAPVWYPAARRWLWPVSLFGIIAIAALNLILGIQQIGLVPRTILPWPLNALIAWQVSIGGALLLTILLWWEILLKKGISASIYALLIEAVTSTGSLLSRGIYIFHTIPQLFALFENRKLLVKASRIKLAALFLAFTALMVISISGVTTFRAYMYPHAGGFTTEEQKRVTRLEVVEGGIARAKRLILKGEPHEGHLLELFAEKAQLERQKKQSRLEVLEGGIARVKKLILQGDRQEGHLQDLLTEKAQLEKLLLKENLQEFYSHEWLAEKTQLERILLSGGPQKKLLGEWLADQIPLEKVLSKNEIKSDDLVVRDKVVNVKNAAPPPSPPPNLLESKSKLISELYYQIGTGAFSRILTLAVDRWIGLEGVMAVHAYPDKSSKLLLDAAKEKREIGKTTKFQEISNSHYRRMDSTIWQFASLPGAAAFFYFSGSLWVVVLGMAILALILQVCEQLIFKLTSNPLLCSMFGLTMANTITQFGVTPRQDIPFYSMIFGFVILVWMAQSDKVAGMYLKHVANRGKRGSV